MEWKVFENGSQDPEVLVLDTKLSYFMNQMCKCSKSDHDIEVHIARNKEDFSRVAGKEHEGEFSANSGNKIVIFEPSKCSETHHSRDQFFEILYQQLFHVLYKGEK